MNKKQKLLEKREQIKKKIRELEKKRQEEKTTEETWGSHESTLDGLIEADYQVWLARLREIEKESKKG